MEELIKRAAIALGLGITEAEVINELKSTGEDFELAWLAVKAGEILNRGIDNE